MRDVRRRDFLRVRFGRLLVKVANVAILNNSCTFPLDKRREGLGGMITILLNDHLNNDDDGKMMMMKE